MSTINLSGLDLPSSLVWVDRYSQPAVVGSERRTIGGKLILSALKLSKGMPITLEGTEDYGWITRDQLVQLIAMASDPAAVYTLLFNGVEYSVAFRHSQSPAVDFRALIPRMTDAPTDYFVGQIKLITV